jgi:hypothetical protein
MSVFHALGLTASTPRLLPGSTTFIMVLSAIHGLSNNLSEQSFATAEPLSLPQISRQFVQTCANRWIQSPEIPLCCSNCHLSARERNTPDRHGFQSNPHLIPCLKGVARVFRGHISSSKVGKGCGYFSLVIRTLRWA